MGWGNVNFDDQDWEYGHPADQDVGTPSAVWKVAAGVAAGIVIGAMAMYVADRHVGEPVWSEAVKALEDVIPGGSATAERMPAQGTRQAAAADTAPPLAERPALPPSTEPPGEAAPAPAAAAETLGRPAASAPGGPLSDLERKQRAWARYYKKPPYCVDNPTSDTLIDCANHYIRARRQFEEAYAAGKL